MFTINDDMTEVSMKTKSGIPVKFLMDEYSECCEIYFDEVEYSTSTAKDVFLNTNKGVICLYVLHMEAEKFCRGCKKEAIDEMNSDEQKRYQNPFGY